MWGQSQLGRFILLLTCQKSPRFPGCLMVFLIVTSWSRQVLGLQGLRLNDGSNHSDSLQIWSFTRSSQRCSKSACYFTHLSSCLFDLSVCLSACSSFLPSCLPSLSVHFYVFWSLHWHFKTIFTPCMNTIKSCWHLIEVSINTSVLNTKGFVSR